MEREFEAYMMIKSTEKSERDNFYLLRICDERSNRYEIIHAIMDAYNHSYNHPDQMHWRFTRFVDMLILFHGDYFFPSSKADYENIISKSHEVKAIPCYIVEINKRELEITYSYSKTIKYSPEYWRGIIIVIKILDSIVKYNFVITNNKCPCTKCIVRAMCLEMRDNLDVTDIVIVEDQIPIKKPFRISRSLEARNPCDDYNVWKKERFKNLWDSLPDDIKELESKNYKEMLLKNSDKN